MTKIAFDGRPAQRLPHSYRRLLDLFLHSARELGWNVELWTDGPLHPECNDYASLTRPFPSPSERLDVDVFWSTTPNYLTRFNTRCVATVCDVNPILPDERNFISHTYRAVRFRRRVKKVFRRNWRVATDSEDARTRLAAEFSRGTEKLSVVPLYADPSLRRVADSDRDKLLAEIGLKAGYLYFVGGFRQHKNWSGLIRAYGSLPGNLRNKHPLVFSGSVGRDLSLARRLMKEFGITDNVRILGETPEQYLAALYSGADIFVFPTFMEGFGLPPLEAMQCGVPVIATNRTAVPEVLGDAPKYIDPADPDEIATAIQEILADSSVQDNMRQAGLQKAAEYNAGRTGLAMEALVSSE